MTKTTEHLAAAIAALAEIEADNGGTASATIYIHGNEELLLYVGSSDADGTSIRTEQTEEGRKFTVAQAVINGVSVAAFGPAKEEVDA
jgi:hypothetical protein